MTDTEALFKLTYGLYVTGVKCGAKYGGCVIDAVMQTTVQPPMLAVCCRQETQTREYIEKTKEFTISVLSETTDPFIIGNFGFQSGRQVDKWAVVSHHLMNGLPVLNNAAAYLYCKVSEIKRLTTHTLFFCEIADARDGAGKALSYTAYRESWKPKVLEAFKNGKCSQNSQNSTGEKIMIKWVCKVCGYEYEGDELPADYVCPVCGVTADQFEKAEEKAAKPAAEKEKWVCSVCGYVYDGDTPFEDLPEDYVCPVCLQPKSVFVKE